jgi:hypothetical protein
MADNGIDPANTKMLPFYNVYLRSSGICRAEC